MVLRKICDWVKVIPLFFFVWGTSFAEVKQYNVNQVTSLLAKIELLDSESFYGTAILREVRVKHNDLVYVYVTSAHIIPKDKKAWSRLRIVSPITRNQPSRVDVLGYNRGADIAVIALGVRLLQPTLRSFAKMHQSVENLRDMIKTVFHRQTITNKKLRLGLLGVPTRMNGSMQTLASFLWQDEIQLISRFNLSLPKTKPKSEANEPRKLALDLSKSKHQLNVVNDCPPLFVNRCYRVPIRSGGYSGGALLASEAKAGQIYGVQIAGMISHFSPLSHWTYAIPMRRVLEESQRILTGFFITGKLYEVVHDKTNTFEYLPDDKVKILKGKLKGMVVQQAPRKGSSTPGSTTHKAGGHAPAGGAISPGGGESAGGHGVHYLIRDRNLNTSGLGSFSVLKSQMKRPDRWHQSGNMMGSLFGTSISFLGSQSLIRYQPGVIFENQSTVFHTAGDSSFVNLPSFLTQYVSNNETDLSHHFGKNSLFRSFSLSQRHHGGIHTWATVTRLKPISVLRKRFKSMEKLTRDYVEKNKLPDKQLQKLGLPVTKQELVWLLIHEGRKGKLGKYPIDVLSSRYNPTYAHISGVKSAKLSLKKHGCFELNANLPVHGRLLLEIPDKFKQQGHRFYRYAGPIKYEFHPNEGDDGPVRLNAFALVTIEDVPDLRMYELKVALAYEEPKIWEDDNEAFQKGEVSMESLFIPLSPDPEAVGEELFFSWMDAQ